ncbi:MAG: DEAD/DEAH box helicase [Thermoplasmata archaeon]
MPNPRAVPPPTSSPSSAPLISGSVPLQGLPIDPEVRAILEASGITALYPPQAAALGPVLEGRSVLLACPTASGKSLVAYLGLLRAVKGGHTGLYLVPLRALAQEKYEEMSAFTSLGVKIGLSMGDFDLPAATLEKLDILIATSEKADGLLRKGSPWLDRLGVVVADEVHLLRDPERGPTLEVSLTRLRRHNPSLQVLALSATVRNSGAVADWLGAVHVTSDFRPVPLKAGVYLDGQITFTDRTERALRGSDGPVPRLVRTVIEEGGQALVFVSTRKGSDQLAQALTSTVRGLLSSQEKESCRALVEELTEAGEEETEGMRHLVQLVPHGVAFHNASLTNPERHVIEQAFKDRRLKVLTATPTLAAGINLPARRVIVRDIMRYEARLGRQMPIPAIEVLQMCGRAGRPRFDDAGEAVLLAKDEEQQAEYLEEVLGAGPENVESRLAAEPALRMHLLALVASGEVHTEAELEQFFQGTFYGHSLPVSDLEYLLGNVRDFLRQHEFLEAGPHLRATAFGHLTSELYFDPLTAVVLRQVLERAPLGVATYPLLAAISATPDMTPLFLRAIETADLMGRYVDLEPELLVKPEEEPLQLELEAFLSTLKTADVLASWMEETPLIDLTDRFGIGAGDVRAKREDAEWLLFGLSRLALRFNRRLARTADDLGLRVRYGVKEELLDLVRVRGIGRVRGRMLFRAGFQDREALRNAPFERLEAALSSRSLAEMVRRQLRPSKERAASFEPRPPPPPPETPATARPPGRRLEDF